jgi:hypothetical protein
MKLDCYYSGIQENQLASYNLLLFINQVLLRAQIQDFLCAYSCTRLGNEHNEGKYSMIM